MIPGGESERKLELELGPAAPWHTMIRVHSLTTSHGRHTTLPYDHLFEVSAEWFGPPAPGMPASRDPVSSQDVYVVDRLELARGLAHLAAAEFGKGGDEPPDLRQLADGLRKPK